ncbi:FxLYD domain-containing protein [Laribacter hongkongensis]|uniref:FxLYD domain-containing protein n=1 Tax=Laribacter hongkongensis TaxID=168471 RepID=UPI001EFC9C0F|nr:FxLYD domain-containing protein [Laribacter hongkongensis]MCG9077116.1 FxLYD domain-containing protein [Laribacter hongkongensis]
MIRFATVALGLVLSTSALAENAGVEVSQLQTVRLVNGIETITGMAQNNSGKKLSNVFVKFNVYDQNGNTVGNTIAHVTDLEAGASWKFQAPYPGPFAKFKVTEIQTF